MLRKLKRELAKRHMKEKGLTRICSKRREPGTSKPNPYGSSYFSRHWREYISG